MRGKKTQKIFMNKLILFNRDVIDTTSFRRFALLRWGDIFVKYFFS